MPRSISIATGVASIAAHRSALDPKRALLVGISGIDGSGKGWIAAQLHAQLQVQGWQAAVLNVDGWLNLPHVRFSRANRAEHFYTHALRLEGFVGELLLPLKSSRRVDAWIDFAEETAPAFRPHRVCLEDIDIVLAEGIFLFKRTFRPIFDLTFWVDCTFETALERAVARAQEGLPPEQTIQAYQTIYFPAQRLHLQRDDPRGGATAVLPNDARLAR